MSLQSQEKEAGLTGPEQSALCIPELLLSHRQGQADWERPELLSRTCPGPRQSRFTQEFPLRNVNWWPCTASGCQPPQGQFQGRNCFGLGFGSENKHSGFDRFTRVGGCFPFQQLLNQPFHSEALGLGGSPGQCPQSSRDVYLEEEVGPAWKV